MILGLAIFVELRLVPHRQTDRDTKTAYTALAQRRAVKTVMVQLVIELNFMSFVQGA